MDTGIDMDTDINKGTDMGMDMGIGMEMDMDMGTDTGHVLKKSNSNHCNKECTITLNEFIAM
jgi:hypothetical protein